MTKEQITDNYPYIPLLFADGLDEAILGIDNNHWNSDKFKERVVYSTVKVIDILIQRDGMSYEDAVEFFDFNIQGSYVGEHTPLFIDDQID